MRNISKLNYHMKMWDSLSSQNEYFENFHFKSHKIYLFFFSLTFICINSIYLNTIAAKQTSREIRIKLSSMIIGSIIVDFVIIWTKKKKQNSWERKDSESKNVERERIKDTTNRTVLVFTAQKKYEKLSSQRRKKKVFHNSQGGKK